MVAVVVGLLDANPELDTFLTDDEFADAFQVLTIT